MAAKARKPQMVCPGDQLADANAFVAGSGTYVLGNHIFASVVGACQISEAGPGSKAMLTVLRHKRATVVPKPGDLVTCRVTKINVRQANVDIIVIGDQPVQEAFPAIIRARDVRAFEIDDVEIFKSFRPGDIVRAEVISLGDSKAYFLSTAQNHLGVISAVSSVSGRPLRPISWQEMADEDGNREFRKVAKVEPPPSMDKAEL